ncbi:transglutaminase domain-containing protein [Bacillus sp. E214]|uniref:transglutaminase domain-containing protein n=1 Tax=Bacillus sp. E214 TaxID=2587156 RepID=UPI0011E063EF|nr:transglutaminase domain-containing protein [Bacillus sp. E214]
MKMKTNNLHPGIRLLLFLFAFIMLIEWMRPVGEVTNTSQIKYFIIFAAVSLVMYAFRVSWKIMTPALSVYIGMSLYLIFYRPEFYLTEDSWIRAFFIDIKEGLFSVFSTDWQGLSPEFRTFLFFILIWMFTYLIHYWVQVKQRLFLFLFMTFIYVTVLDTFTTYDSNQAIVRVVVIGFAILGMLALVRLLIGENIHYTNRTAIRWLIPLSSMIVFAVVIGFFAPKPQAIWPDPISFIKSTSEKFGSTQKRIGYDKDDSKLGGDFVGDDGVVFRASSSVRTYWKIENKNVYTGKGWETGADYGMGQTILESEPTMLYDYRGENTNTVSTAELEFEIDHGHIPYPSPMAIEQIYNLNPEDESVFSSVLYSGDSSEITPIYEEDTNKNELKKVGMQFRSPTYYLDVLQQDEINDLYEMEMDLLISQSLGLPDYVPERVSSLAIELAEKTGSNSMYDQVKAIEDYLKGEQFTYSKEDVPYPEESQDYVDQFLFETQIGYCDNFSSAMVVLVRSLGIPARWVKGYTAGDLVYDQQLGESRYVITNNNAHSWPEVYFPSVGWVPFEPTRGFSSEVRFTVSQEVSNDQEETQVTPETNQPENKEPEKPVETKDTASQFTFGTIKDKVAEHWKKALVVILVLGGAAVLLYRIRGKWMPHIWVFYYKRLMKKPNYSNAYMQLLRELNRYGIKRKPGQTLREYAIYVDRFFGSSDMNRLTHAYEKHIYSGEKIEMDWRNFQEQWEKMILRTIA